MAVTAIAPLLWFASSGNGFLSLAGDGLDQATQQLGDLVLENQGKNNSDTDQNNDRDNVDIAIFLLEELLHLRLQVEIDNDQAPRFVKIGTMTIINIPTNMMTTGISRRLAAFSP